MRTKELATRIVYVRHGKTDFPLDRIYCDETEDPALNSEGVAQAEKAAATLVDTAVDAVYASPSLRTRMTSAVIANKHGLSPVYLPEWVERRFGIWEGLYFNEIEARYPEEYLHWKRDNAGFKPERGESIYDLSERVSPSLQQLIERHQGRCIVVVSHVGPIRTVLANALGVDLRKYRSLTIDYASVSVVDYGKSQNNLICINR